MLKKYAIEGSYEAVDKHRSKLIVTPVVAQECPISSSHDLSLADITGCETILYESIPRLRDHHHGGSSPLSSSSFSLPGYHSCNTSRTERGIDIVLAEPSGWDHINISRAITIHEAGIIVVSGNLTWLSISHCHPLDIFE